MKEPKRYCCGNGEGMFEDDKNGHWIEYSEHKAIVKELTKQLRKHDVMRSVYAVYPDAERLDIGKNRLSAIFRDKDHAEEFAKSKWGRYYIIEEMSSDHFA